LNHGFWQRIFHRPLEKDIYFYFTLCRKEKDLEIIPGYNKTDNLGVISDKKKNEIVVFFPLIMAGKW